MGEEEVAAMPRRSGATSEASARGPDGFPPEYRRWNGALARHFFGGEMPAEEAAVHLSLTPAVVLALGRSVDPEVSTPEEAEASLVASVGNCYRSIVAETRGGLQRLDVRLEDGTPASLAFLVASVLAGHRMQSDVEAQGMAYYIRLAKLLGVDCVRGVPRGFDQREFEGLWLALESWAGDLGKPLARPVEGRLRRYVAWPMVHVLLRQLDLDRVPEFFLGSGFPPGSAASPATLEHPFVRWASTHLTDAGKAALQDERRYGVLGQVAAELKRWDGSLVDQQGRSIATVDILLDVRQRMPCLEYVARRPAGFPPVFDAEDRVFQAGDFGWYEPTTVGPDDGPLLAEGFTWEVVSADGERRCALRRAPAQCIAFVAGDEYTGCVSHGALKLHANGGVLCTDEFAVATASYLSAVCCRAVTAARQCPTVPKGWQLFLNVKPARHDVPVPQAMEALSVRTETEVVVEGGLRLGRRWAWLTSAPPSVSVYGEIPGGVVTVDGTAFRAAEDGTVEVGSAFSVAGEHVIEAGYSRRRIEIVEPFVAENVWRPPELEGPAPHSTALPPGQWVLVGPTPGQVHFSVSSRAGALGVTAWRPAAALSLDRKSTRL